MCSVSPRPWFRKRKKTNAVCEAYTPNEQEVKNLLAWVGVDLRDVRELDVLPGKVVAKTDQFSYDFDLEDTWDPHLEYDFPWNLEKKSLDKS